MIIQENGPERDKGSEPLNTSKLGSSNTANIKQKSEVPQEENAAAPGHFAGEPFPSFLELVAQNAEAPMRRASAYLRICAELSSIGDYEGFCEAGDKFLDAGREFAKLLVLLKTPTIFSNEKADRLEEKALALHELADLTEMEASQIRQVVRP
jgi:hypothetical protein